MAEIRNLTAGYGGEAVLKALSASFPEGQVTVIIGPNGCGKSTLLKAVAGLIPAEGEIRAAGELLGAGKARARAAAYLPQSREVPKITVERLVLHGRFPYLSYPRRYTAKDRAMAREAMARMGLAGLEQRELESLSGGQRQRAYIAMALAQDTALVLLDEPTTYLDIAHQRSLMALARELAQAGKAVVLVLHDLTLALEQGDQILVMAAGAIAAQGTAAQVLPSLEAVFGVRVKAMQTPDGIRYYYG